MPAARLTVDDRPAEQGVEFFHRFPGPTIGHAHRPPRHRDRPEGGDLFQQFDLAGTDAALGVEMYAEAQGRYGTHRHSDAGPAARFPDPDINVTLTAIPAPLWGQKIVSDYNRPRDDLTELRQGAGGPPAHHN